MITNMIHAREVQERRVRSGKRGIARAVRRYLTRTYRARGEYLEARRLLLVKWRR